MGAWDSAYTIGNTDPDLVYGDDDAHRYTNERENWSDDQILEDQEERERDKPVTPIGSQQQFDEDGLPIDPSDPGGTNKPPSTDHEDPEDLAGQYNDWLSSFWGRVAQKLEKDPAIVRFDTKTKAMADTLYDVLVNGNWPGINNFGKMFGDLFSAPGDTQEVVERCMAVVAKEFMNTAVPQDIREFVINLGNGIHDFIDWLRNAL